jgi:hypothetical protein
MPTEQEEKEQEEKEQEEKELAERRDRVRLLISDTGGDDGESFIFSDVEIENFLDLRKENVFLAAALALNTLAGNEAQVSKAIKFMNLSTDGPAVAMELRKLAIQLTEQGHEVAGVKVGADSEGE